MSKERGALQSNGCILWNSCVDKDGYGVINTTYWDKFHSFTRAHRLAHFIYNGEFDRKLFVCHRCNTSSCINPEHLYAGTHTDNMRDRVNSGYYKDKKGENSTSNKLSNKDVYEIRDLLNVMTHKRIADFYGVKRQTITNISTNHRWASI